jgi:hypothetical protein
MSKKATIPTEKPITKQDAMVLLSDQLRNPKLDSELFVKVLTLYSKICGWDKEKEPSPDEALTFDQQVAAIEKKRKNNA